MQLENNLKGKIAFITGASSGIGEATAYALAKEGCHLILSARRYESLEVLKEKLEKEFSIPVLTLALDVRNAKSVEKTIASLAEKWKGIEILVNNAGLALGMDKVYQNSVEDIDTVIDTNVKGMLYVTKAVVPLMLAHQKVSTIVNLGSTAGDAAYGGGTVYCASKAAMKALSDGLRIDLIDTPIKVTNVKPGMVETNFSKIRFKGDEEKAKKVYQGIEALTPQDIAATISYICNLSDNVQIPEITMTPLHQADGRTVYKK